MNGIRVGYQCINGDVRGEIADETRRGPGTRRAFLICLYSTFRAHLLCTTRLRRGNLRAEATGTCQTSGRKPVSLVRSAGWRPLVIQESRFRDL